MWPNDVERPSETLRRVLAGELAMESAPAAIQSWARFEIHNGAKSVLAIPTTGERRNMLGRIPALVRPHVEAEARRIFSGK
jgi:hypothetical protein